jgi:hypothetical protein
VPTREELTWKHIEENKTLHTVRSVLTMRKQVKRNRKPDETRRKDWNFDTDNLDAFYDLDVSAEERLMPRGERERRRTLLTSALTQQREPDRPAQEAPAARAQRVLPRAHAHRRTLPLRRLLAHRRARLRRQTGRTGRLDLGSALRQLYQDLRVAG